MEIIDFRPLHVRALHQVTALIERVGDTDGTRATPCPPWDLNALLGHMIGQNHGFADAVDSAEDLSLDAFAARPPTGRPAEAWAASVDRISTAFASADLARPVLLAEISQEHRVPTWTAVGFQLLDTVVHGWDVATSLGLPYRPDDELVATTLRLAELVPAGPERERPDAAFAPVLPYIDSTDKADPWARSLALLGRAVPAELSRP